MKTSKNRISPSIPDHHQSAILVHCSHAQLVDVTELVANPRNPNKHSDKQVALLAKIIRHQGWRSPITVSNRSGFVVTGHGRLQAAILLGEQLVPVDRQDFASEADEWAHLVADNRIAELADADKSMIADLLKEIDAGGLDMDLTGFDMDALEELLSETNPPDITEDEVPDMPVDPITKPGDLWILGDHRVLCGDSTKAQDVERLMGDAGYDLLMIDPPYGIKAATMTMGSAQSSKPKHDRLSNVEQWDGARPKIAHLITGKACVWGGNYFAHDLPISDDWLCWWKKNDNLSFGEFELAWCNYGKRTRHLSHHWGGEKKEHITQKPVAVIAWAIQQSETTGLICDLFLGSGTTLIAAEQLGRKCYGMEISPAYCDVIVKRWENLTGKKATLEVTNGKTRPAKTADSSKTFKRESRLSAHQQARAAAE